MLTSPQNLQIWIHYYFLKRKAKPNSRVTVSDQVQAGALIKIQDEDGNEGFADLCPWPALGDSSLDEEIKNQGPLFQRSLQLAQADLEARHKKIQLVCAEPVKNNILVTDYQKLDAQLNQDLNLNFLNKTVKIKGHEQVSELAQFLVKHVQRFSHIRIDFNFCLSEFLFAEFINLLSEEVLEKIEYIEDPFFFNENKWQFWNAKVPLALDWNHSDQHQWSRRIWKPSRELCPAADFITMTSAMDHPVGIAHGLHFAQKKAHQIHGFLTIDQYEHDHFFKDFEINDDSLIYHSDGYGIGFTQLLAKMNWIPLLNLHSPFLVSNHRLSEKEKKDLFQIKKSFQQDLEKNKNFKNDEFILIPSSGSTQQAGDSVKVFALSKTAMINSAKRVNRAFAIHEKSVLGCVLPLFHVGGLAIYFRSLESRAKIVYASWAEFNLSWIEDHQITHLSLVPTQIFEIVQNKWLCPPSLKTVFVGGAALDAQLAEQAVQLKWPIVQTYGMTETGSMIAVKKNIKNDFFDVLDGIEISVQDQLLAIKADSLASFEISQNQIKKIDSWYLTQDQVLIQGQQFRFLQRVSDFIKIKGEGVSLAELRGHLSQILLQMGLSDSSATICDWPDLRDGASLILVTTAGFSMEDILKKLNLRLRPYERVERWVEVDSIPRTDLGKIKFAELKNKIKDQHVKKLSG